MALKIYSYIMDNYIKCDSKIHISYNYGSFYMNELKHINHTYISSSSSSSVHTVRWLFNVFHPADVI